jgi:hypothetical protein
MRHRTCILLLLFGFVLAWTVLPGQQAVTIGTGDQQAGIPFNLYYRYSLFETIYHFNEIPLNGTITSIRFYSNWQGDNLEAIPIQVWLGTTTQPDLSAGWIPSGQLTQVYDDSLDFTFSQNVVHIDLETPFVYSGANLVIMLRSPWQSTWLSQMPQFLCQTGITNRARNFYSDTVSPDPTNPPPGGSLSGQFPKTTLYFSNITPEYDMAALDISYDGLVSVGLPENVTIHISNAGTQTQSSYQVKLYNWNNSELASYSGQGLQPGQTETVNLIWQFPQPGIQTLYAKIIAQDNNLSNNQTQSITVEVQPPLGLCICPPLTSTSSASPFETSYKSCLFETIYDNLALHPNHLSGLGMDMLGAVTFFKVSGTATINRPIKIWLGNSTADDITAGWIPASQLRLVYDGWVTIPAGATQFTITFQQPFHALGESPRFVMLVYMPFNANNEMGSSSYDCYSMNSRSRVVFSNSEGIDPNSPPFAAGYLQDIIPKAHFHNTYEQVGSLRGNVFAGSSQVLPNATISINELNYTTLSTISGEYHFNLLYAGYYNLTVSSPAYTTQVVNVTVNGHQLLLHDFHMQGSATSAQISGRVVNSHQVNEPVVNAQVLLSGFNSYSTTTNAAGYFTFYNVPTNQSYTCEIVHSQYVFYTTILELFNDYNFGNIMLEEVLTPPDSVIATANAQHTVVNISWQAPVPDTTRVLQGYKVWRLLPGQESTQSQWTLLTPSAIWATVYADMGFVPPAVGTWCVKWAVKAVYSGGSESQPAFSNGITGGIPNGLLSGTVTNIDNNFPLFVVTITINP